MDIGERPTTWRNATMKERRSKGRCRKLRTGKFEKKDRGIVKL
jgi:hypothetical protein